MNKNAIWLSILISFLVISCGDDSATSPAKTHVEMITAHPWYFHEVSKGDSVSYNYGFIGKMTLNTNGTCEVINDNGNLEVLTWSASIQDSIFTLDGVESHLKVLTDTQLEFLAPIEKSEPFNLYTWKFGHKPKG